MADEKKSPEQTPPEQTSPVQLHEIARKWVEVGWQQGNAAAVYEMYDPEFVDWSNPTGYPGTRDENVKGITALYAAFPDFFATIEDMFINARIEKVVIRWIAIGTHKGPFLGAAPTGKQITFHGIEILQVRNGLIIERAGEWDEGFIMRQLGVHPEEPSVPTSKKRVRSKNGAKTPHKSKQSTETDPDG